MTVRGKEYQIMKAEDLSLKQTKILLLTANAYDDYVEAKDDDEAKKYEKLKALWKSLTASIVLNTDAVVQDIDNVGMTQFSEFISHFFPKSSEAPKS